MQTTTNQHILSLAVLTRHTAQIKGRRHYLKSYGRCFAGAKAVDWCVANGKSSSRQEAILLMTTLLQKGTSESPPSHTARYRRSSLPNEQD